MPHTFAYMEIRRPGSTTAAAMCRTTLCEALHHGGFRLSWPRHEGASDLATGHNGVGGRVANRRRGHLAGAFAEDDRGKSNRIHERASARRIVRGGAEENHRRTCQPRES